MLRYLLIAALLSGAPAHGGPHETQRQECRFQYLDHATWTSREEIKTLACVVDRFGPIDGGIPKAVAVGNCESGWYRFASNGGSYLGIFQHSASAWPYRVRSYMPSEWRIGPWEHWQNPRSQAVVTVRMVRAGGWGPWSCA